MATRKKSEAELLAEAELEQQIIDLRVMGTSWRDIATELSTKEKSISHETVRTMFLKARTKRVKQRSENKMAAHIVEEDAALMYLIREAHQGWKRSVGSMEKTVHEIGDTPKGPVDKTTTTNWEQAGDVRFITEMGRLRDLRNRVLGVYDKDREKEDEDIDLVQFQQHVYIPGLEMLTPELIKQMIQAGVVPPMPDDTNG